MNRIHTEIREIEIVKTEKVHVVIFEFKMYETGSDNKNLFIEQLSRLLFSYVRSDAVDDFFEKIGVKNQIEAWNIIRKLAQKFPKEEF
jgi:hypothetical protein